MVEKAVIGYEGLYSIRENGDIFSTPRHGTRGGVIKQFPNRKGYLLTYLTRDGATKAFAVHRLVATHFIGPPPFDGAQVDHIDGDKANNAAANLEYVSCRENILRSWRNGHHTKSRAGSANNASKLTDQTVSEIRARVKAGERRDDVARLYGVDYSNVCLIVARKTWKHVA